MISPRLLVTSACAFHAATVSATPDPAADSASNPKSDPTARPSDRISAVASVGLAAIFFGYDSYGVAFPVRAGVDVPLGHIAWARHSLLAGFEYAHFSRGFVAGIDPFPVRGLAFDAGSLRLAWRVIPSARIGLHFDAGAGLLVGRDQIRLELPDRVVRSSETRTGVPLELGAGWLFGEHIDVALRYTHVVFTSDEPAAMGFPELAIAVRL